MVALIAIANAVKRMLLAYCDGQRCKRKPLVFRVLLWPTLRNQCFYCVPMAKAIKPMLASRAPIANAIKPMLLHVSYGQRYETNASLGSLCQTM